MCGLIFAGSPPWARIASRIAARSTTHGTPVKSWSRTRAGANAISRVGSSPATQPATDSTSSSRPLRRTFSSRIRSVYGRRATSQCACSSSSRKTSYVSSPTRSCEEAATARFNQTSCRARRGSPGRWTTLHTPCDERDQPAAEDRASEDGAVRVVRGARPEPRQLSADAAVDAVQPRRERGERDGAEDVRAEGDAPDAGSVREAAAGLEDERHRVERVLHKELRAPDITAMNPIG